MKQAQVCAPIAGLGLAGPAAQGQQQPSQRRRRRRQRPQAARRGAGGHAAGSRAHGRRAAPLYARAPPRRPPRFPPRAPLAMIFCGPAPPPPPLDEGGGRGSRAAKGEREPAQEARSAGPAQRARLSDVGENAPVPLCAQGQPGMFPPQDFSCDSRLYTPSAPSWKKPPSPGGRRPPPSSARDLRERGAPTGKALLSLLSPTRRLRRATEETGVD